MMYVGNSRYDVVGSSSYDVYSWYDVVGSSRYGVYRR
jgi:hypothetical protein